MPREVVETKVEKGKSTCDRSDRYARASELRALLVLECGESQIGLRCVSVEVALAESAYSCGRQKETSFSLGVGGRGGGKLSGGIRDEAATSAAKSKR